MPLKYRNLLVMPEQVQLKFACYNRVNSLNPTYPGVAVFQKLVRSLHSLAKTKPFTTIFLSLSLSKKGLF